MTSLPQSLSDTNVDRIVSRLGLTEVKQDDGPFMTLTSNAPFAQGPVGSVRVFEGGGIDKLVTCSIVVPAIGLDSHMLFAFTPANSLVPHFTLDSVKAGEHYAFHLDMIPRADLGQHIEYMNQVYQPLTEKFDAAEAMEGITKAHISPRQRAIMSPWMLVHRATEAAFTQLFDHAGAYLDYWFDLLSQPLELGISAEQIATRDKANRAAIFSPDIDPVWKQIDGLIGQTDAEALRRLLRGE